MSSKVLFAKPCKKVWQNAAIELMRSLDETRERSRRKVGNKQRSFSYQKKWRLKYERLNRLSVYCNIVNLMVAKGSKYFTVVDIIQYWPSASIVYILEDLRLLGLLISDQYKKIPAGALLVNNADINGYRSQYATTDSQYRKSSTVYNRWTAQRSKHGKSYDPPNVLEFKRESRALYGSLQNNLQNNPLLSQLHATISDL